MNPEVFDFKGSGGLSRPPARSTPYDGQGGPHQLLQDHQAPLEIHETRSRRLYRQAHPPGDHRLQTLKSGTPENLTSGAREL